MSNYHVLFQELERKSVHAIFHIPIPAAGVNGAGIGWRAAALMERQFNGGIGKSVLPGIASEELTALDNGSLIEVLERVRFTSTSLTDAQRNTQILEAYNAATTSVLAEKQITLNFMGYNSTP